MKKAELIDRYIRELTKYMTYDNAKRAEKDVRELIAEELSEDYSYEELEKVLLKFGSPYNLASKYESKSNILISGKNYTIYIKLLKTLSLNMVLATVIYFLINKSKFSILNTLNIFKTEMVSIFFCVTLSLWIAEEVKSKKIMGKLIKSFEIEDLYIVKPKINKPMAVPLVLSSIFIFLLMIEELLKGDEGALKTVQGIFFLLVLRDSNKLSEDGYGRYVTFLSIACDILSLVLMYFLYEQIYKVIYIKIFLYVIIFFIIFDLWFAIIQIVRIYKNGKNKA
ncbi:hypothetical protein [Anaerosphaera multitolerans]|uniref:Uncharacterized protein n=1 Tax=Anaerosphaera multitolerans TaxID=2487351 RepID=A0A437S9L9_9FIRM|nr:hypothetical protein [Anaerosphaera multitolerans]RVU55581.1 hypothetical protein EF514_02300 [Anaerosphaera multitolerans]